MSRNISSSFNPGAWDEYLAVQHEQLPKLPNVEQVSTRVVRFQAGNPGMFQLQGTSTYLIGTGRSRILIDTGEGHQLWAENLFAYLEKNDLDLEYILLTHWHGDHTGGVPQLLASYPHLCDSVYKNKPDNGQRNISDDQIFAVEGATIRAVFTPGHSADHMCFVLEEENAFFTGDNVLGHGFTVFEDLGVFMASLEKMRAQNCAKGYPAHGIVIENLPTRIALYIGRNRRWERQILAALRASRAKATSGKGSVSTDELVVLLFGDIGQEVSTCVLRPFVDEVLLKLAGDGKIGFEMRPGSTCKSWFARLL